MEIGIRDRLAMVAIPPLPSTVLGNIATDPSVKLTSRIIDGMLVLAIDATLNGGVTSGGELIMGVLTTAGDPNALSENLRGRGIALWKHPILAIDEFSIPIYISIKKEVDRNNARLDSFSLGLEEGGFRIHSVASKTGGSVPFSFKAVPKLFRTVRHLVQPSEAAEEVGDILPHYETETRQELWFEPQEIDVDSSRGGGLWERILEGLLDIFTAFIPTIVIEFIFYWERRGVEDGIRNSNQHGSSLTAVITLPNHPIPQIFLTLRSYECHPNAVFADLELKAQLSSGFLYADRFWLDAFEVATRSSKLTFSVRLPETVLDDNPELRIRWVIRRSDTGETVYSRDGRAQEVLALPLSTEIERIWLFSSSSFTVEVRVYRMLGATTEELFKDKKMLEVRDELDRSHPFVRWQHEVCVPIVEAKENGMRKHLYWKIETRNSAIHRTDLPGRCSMASRYSAGAPRAKKPLPPARLEYLDSLPFSRDMLVERRDEVCDYCFFGGPTHKVPLIP